MAKPRVFVYIDGFNLYNGLACADRLNCRWVNLHKLFANNQLANSEVIKVKFFTAPVLGPTLPNQYTYIRALKTLPSIEVIEGFFQKKTIRCNYNACPLVGPAKRFERPSEKKTDVSIASAMFEDGFLNDMDEVALVSGDSDFVPALETMRRCFPHVSLKVFVPTMGVRYAWLTSFIKGEKMGQSPYAKELREAAHSSHDVSIPAFLRSQFPETITDQEGNEIKMPSSWTRAENRTFTKIMSDLEDKASKLPGYKPG